MIKVAFYVLLSWFRKPKGWRLPCPSPQSPGFATMPSGTKRCLAVYLPSQGKQHLGRATIYTENNGRRKPSPLFSSGGGGVSNTELLRKGMLEGLENRALTAQS